MSVMASYTSLIDAFTLSYSPSSSSASTESLSCCLVTSLGRFLSCSTAAENPTLLCRAFSSSLSQLIALSTVGLALPLIFSGLTFLSTNETFALSAVLFSRLFCSAAATCCIDSATDSIALSVALIVWLDDLPSSWTSPGSAPVFPAAGIALPPCKTGWKALLRPAAPMLSCTLLLSASGGAISTSTCSDDESSDTWSSCAVPTVAVGF